jgi:Fe2+ or Zn2+ uptake regulation protein
MGDIEAPSGDRIVAALNSVGLRITRQRQVIIDYLAGRHDHPSARQIFRDLTQSEARPSLATVYNTLAILVELGVIAEMEFEATDNRYDTNLAPHLNLVCTVCGSIEDVDGEPPVGAAELRRQTGFETTAYRLECRGICARCQPQTTKDPSRRPS